MKTKKLKMTLKMLIVAMLVTLISQGAAAQDTGDAPDNSFTEASWKALGAGIALGLCGIGAGFSQAQVGSAAVGMVSEGGSFGNALLFTVLPETIVILGLLPFFV